VVLDRIVTEARRFTHAEAATLFLREGPALRFDVVQNKALVTRFGEEEMRRRLTTEVLPLDAYAIPRAVRSIQPRVRASASRCRSC
jgi:hypothetical protein